MPHAFPLIATVAAALGLALLFGFAAARIKLPAIVGYLLAGIILGPHTPGFVADVALARQLAEFGIILLMFGVGLHFSMEDLLAVRRIALPGVLVQMAAATVLGAVVARSWGWGWGGGLVFGLSLSVASTVVLIGRVQERGRTCGIEVESRGAAGWKLRGGKMIRFTIYQSSDEALRATGLTE